ncbi:hypothetical protein F4818DRAFT_410016 [Hypoxylon cercidicola]|nr:hypothetical protein F4818DRAFT_410016 [Hypoxylon cercidicola]
MYFDLSYRCIMAEPASYRGYGQGDTRRHSSHKRTRGDDEHGVKHVRRRYDDDERSINGRHDDRSRRRSLSPRDRSQRPKSHRSRHDAYRQDEGPRDSDSNIRSDDRAPARSPSTSSMRHRSHRHHRRHRSIHATNAPDELPFGSRLLVRSDLENFRPLFAQYLEIQKQKDITALDEREVKGRWKSFVGKWNHGELAEGWYSPETLTDARRNYTSVMAEQDTSSSRPPPPHNQRDREVSDGGSSATRPKEEEDDDSEEEDEEDDDEYGPTLPSNGDRSARHGPGVPSLQDLALRRETAEEERQRSVDALRLARKAERASQREKLEELAPRADAGTRERRLEKRREVNDKMRGFRERSPGAVGEVGETELMGGDADGGVAEYKKAQEAARRRRSEREVRREEEARAKAAEREVRVEEYRRKEECTMQVLRQIARERFG